MKHKPATPLPWDSVALWELVAAQGDQSKLSEAQKTQDDDYAKHAANAYPLLVNFLHVLAQNRRDRACTKQWIEDEAKTLLHELGEYRP